ncbi:histidine kinase N-terminal 7TM domain-containing protein [Neobacillus cucumis]|uniref:histidine kinase N-terminal 7TM domain-containing protein n=1 Tax=Neobacillus cucumis TaxID=1740721 RepID=UPI0019653C9B|nr:histidine kinase N-terminal 7TM domain-containing protein [Neobacillus cucumis]MBM7655190.1 hypothetical protein [Neobacillus cucumis]
MNSLIFQYIVIISVSGVLSVLLTIYAFVKKELMSSRKTFIIMSVLSAIYIFGHALELSSSTINQISFWIKFQYCGLPFIAPTCLVLVLQYVGLDKFLTRGRIISLFIIPLITFLLSWTNDIHHWMYRSLYLRPDVTSPVVDMITGPWYVVHGSFTFGSLLLGTCILLWYWQRTKATYWKQIVTLIASLVIPMIASFLYLIGLSPYGMDPVPMVCALPMHYISGGFSLRSSLF